MADPYVSFSPDLTSPASKVAAVIPSNSVDLTTPAKALYIGVAGDVKIDTAGGSSGVTFTAHPVGYLMARASRVYATGTTATNIVALYD